VPIVQLMGVATVITGVTRTFALYLIAADRSGVCSIVTTIGAGWHLVTAALGALIWGAEGVAVAICGT
jgi:O-antigen/teichoic acid export membrane protein